LQKSSISQKILISMLAILFFVLEKFRIAFLFDLVNSYIEFALI